MRPAAISLLALSLAACASGEPELLNLRAGDSPDEFAIVPNEPLEMPPGLGRGLAELPTPTPGGANRTDKRPSVQAAQALGGTGVSGDAAPGVVAYAGRYGTDPGVRGDLAAADLEYRQRRDGRLLERLFGQNVYYRAYRPQELDQYQELDRLRARGIRTPAAPPPEAVE